MIGKRGEAANVAKQHRDLLLAAGRGVALRAGRRSRSAAASSGSTERPCEGLSWQASRTSGAARMRSSVMRLDRGDGRQQLPRPSVTRMRHVEQRPLPPQAE